MIPFERDIYLALLKDHVDKVNEEMTQERLKQEAKEKLRY
jgi:hypothetical protein